MAKSLVMTRRACLNIKSLILLASMGIISSCSHHHVDNQTQSHSFVFDGDWQFGGGPMARLATGGKRYENRIADEDCDEDRADSGNSSMHITIRQTESSLSLQGTVLCHQHKQLIINDSFSLKNMAIRGDEILIDDKKVGAITSQILSLTVGPRNFYFDFSTGDHKGSYRYRFNDGGMGVGGTIGRKTNESN
jgi:hypothetical protein